MSRTTYVGSLIGQGHALPKLAIVLFLVFAILGTNPQTSPHDTTISRLLGLWSLVLLSYVTTIVAILGSWADLTYFRGMLRKQSYKANHVYRQAAIYVSRLIRAPILVILSILFIIIYLLSPMFSATMAGIATMSGLFTFAILLLIWIPKQLIDYFFLFAALFGRDRTMASNLAALVRHNLEIIGAAKPQVSSKDLFLGLAESDLRHAEVLLEWINLTVTIGAIVISVILTERLVSSYDRLYDAMMLTFRTFGAKVSALTQLPYANAISTGILIVLMLFAINFLLGFVSLLMRTVLRYYFEVYRPAYALRQSFILYFDSPFPVPSPAQTAADIDPAKAQSPPSQDSFPIA